MNPHKILKDAATNDLIEQQAERIKELETIGLDLQMANQRIKELEANVWYLKGVRDDELAALRQRIADAPVVAWMGEYNINEIREHRTVVVRHKTDFDGMPERVRALIFKEDLK